MFTLMLCNTGNAQSQPVANFSANIVHGCSPILVNFTDQSSGNPTEWKWDLGNGTISNLQNPSVTYFAPGLYTVKLIVKTANNSDSVTKTNYINVFASATVKFNASATVGCNPFTVIFTDETTPNSGISSWQWDFGDGLISNQQHPPHVYTLPGSYSVTLKVVTSNGCVSNLRKSAYISNNTIKAAFINFTSSPCLPNKVSFQNNSTGTGNITSKWDFGDSTTSTLTTPVHNYATGGIYTVRLVVKNQFGCTDTFSKNLAVANPVSAAFTADHPQHCKAPATVTFANQTLAGNTYYWGFGDSTSTTVSNPVHVYGDTGIYTVKLVVKNSNGCGDSLTKTSYIKIYKPFITLKDLPDSGCTPFVKSFSIFNNSTVSISSYSWSLGDGSTSILPNPVHTYNSVGSYNISVVATAADGCTDTAYMQNAIRLSTKPVANFSADITNTCASTKISFTDLSTGGANSWFWSFGDNDFSVEQNPVHVYKDTGWMTVTLTAFNGGCMDAKTLVNYIYVKPAVAKFNFAFECGNRLQRTFNNLSFGADRIQWDFGDGTTSVDSFVVHSFPGPGIYYVQLSAWNDSTGCDYVATKRIKVLDLSLNFYAADTNLCKGASTSITTGAANTDILKYYWDFGDDTVIATKNESIAHAYKNNGTYTLKLITVDSLNCMDTVVKPMYINVHGPTASFGVLNNGGCINAPVFFSDSSVAGAGSAISSWAWNFGDGTKDTFTTPPFLHTYKNQGSYWVSLKLTDAMNCTDSLRLPSRIVIKKPGAGFYANDSLACPGYPIKFTCPYSETGIIYKWDFGDGSSINGAQSPVHAYLHEGVFTVKLIIINSFGCGDTSTVVNMIRVKQTLASFEMSDSFRTCPPLLIQFTNHDQGAGITESWSFGDSSFTNTHNPSHFYTYPGKYTAMLIAKGPGACADTMKRVIVVKGPKGNISYSPLNLCKPYQVNFTAHTEDAVSYIWDFNDGVTAAGADTSIRYIYQDSGTFLPKIILVDDIGCRVAITGKDSITNVFVKPLFTFPDSVLCNGGSVSFINTATSNDHITAHKWHFGDSTVSGSINPVHQYLLPGVYYPSLSVTTATGCTGEYKSPVPVRVALSPSISMLITGNGCTPLNATFNAVLNSSDTSGISWLWNMGNGNTAALQNPPVQVFNTPGTYTISLTASSSNGCSKTIQQTVEAFASPVVKIAGNNSLCSGLSLNLSANGGVQYKWFPAASLNCDTCSSVIAHPIITTQYTVTGKSLQGCSSSDSVTINVKQPFVMTYGRATSICLGQSSRLEASGASTYQWYPAQGLNSSTVASPTARPDSTINYRVVGTDDAGCFKDTGYVKITVYKNPTVDAGADKTVSAGLPVDLVAVYSSDVTDVRWSPTGDIFRAGTNVITVKPMQHTEYTIDVKNPGGCAASDRVKVNVNFDGSNVFIPNLFSPNHDGVNDVFYPRGRGVYKIKKLAIFSRWGEMVFEKTNFNSNDPSVGWDGTFRGERLTTDVFVYVVELIGENGTILPVTGNVSLVR
ncbi:MAG: PKD domain-containing protein [Chitinophagaceae bacterium]|nr:PKD domain-containing protein [Chitinophagaceae bacterium]